MNDSEADLGARKKPDEKYYFFVEKSSFEKVKNIKKADICGTLSGKTRDRPVQPRGGIHMSGRSSTF